MSPQEARLTVVTIYLVVWLTFGWGTFGIIKFLEYRRKRNGK